MIQLTTFIHLSEVLTGANKAAISSRKEQRQLAETYFDILSREVPAPKVKALLKKFNAIAAATAPEVLMERVRAQILADDTLGPLAKSIIRMWQLGVWCNDSQQNNIVISSIAFKNGMVWGTMGAHPIGYNSEDLSYWNTLPVIPPIP